MKNTQILLRETIKDLGIVGEVVSVRPGYARNFLLPQGKAVDATPENIKMFERRKIRYQAEMARQEADIQKRIELLASVELSVTEKADQSGTLYGSVSAAVIARLLSEAGHTTEEKEIRLEEPIKKVGTHEVAVHIHGDHFAGIRLTVSPEAKPASEPEAEAPSEPEA